MRPAFSQPVSSPVRPPAPSGAAPLVLWVGLAVLGEQAAALISARTVMFPIPEERVCDIYFEKDFHEAHYKYTVMHGGIVK